ncbi:MAG: glycogen debranching enzyme [SAR324 cluster bacterium]|nr:glycogen debranching enzyme [SAR324 cluster bacterium]
MSIFTNILPLPVASPGTLWRGDQLQFSLYTEIAEEIEYCFYANPYQIKTGEDFPLLERVILKKDQFCFGEFWNWTASLSEDRSDSLVGYLIRVWKKDIATGKKAGCWIFDPHARESTGGEDWGQSYHFQIDPKDYTLRKSLRSSSNFKEHPRRLSVLRSSSPGPARPERPKHPFETSVIYECHVRSMTCGEGATLSDSRFSGTYQGLVEQIPYLLELGITAVELLPIYDFDETENWKKSPLTGERLLNYWGYSPISFFVPKQSYAFDRQDPVSEFKKMVDAFHQAGLEVILDVVYNHTGELDENGPVDHFKCLGEENWYLHDEEKRLLNYSGCGNTLRCAHFAVKQMILASLRYWANEIGVDGFRFDLTTILDRDHEGEIQKFPTLLWEIQQDPALNGIKMIAEPWDAGGGYQVGHLAHHAHWAEWNDQYRDSIRQAVQGAEGMMGQVKNCILGSPNLYQTVEKGRRFSINFITAHDGMTMWDLVAYRQKQNAINGESNRDGTSENYSSNCGEEGPSDVPEIKTLRENKIKLFHFLLQLSGGIPMMLAGDEMGRSQQGNNNAYCLDNPVNWIDWSLLFKNKHLFQFVQHAIAFRKANHRFLFSDQSRYQWFNSLGNEEDLRHHIRTLVWKVNHPDFPEKDICMMLNCYSEAIEFRFPGNRNWRCLFNTALENLPDQKMMQGKVNVEGFSLLVLESIDSCQ